MSRGEHRPPIRRILIALDDSTPGAGALETVAALASRLEAELLGLFVEDANLLRFAALPFARELGFFSARARRLGSVEMERALRAQAARAEAALIEAAGRRRVRCTFRVVRGEVTAQLLAAAHDMDLVALGMWRRELRRLGPAVRGIVAAARSSVLLLTPDAGIRAPVAVVYDASPGSVRALAVARDLAQAQAGVLTVLNAGKAEEAQAEIAQSRGEGGPPMRYRSLPAADPAGVARAVRQEAAGTLVLSASLYPEEAMLDELLERVECTVFLVP